MKAPVAKRGRSDASMRWHIDSSPPLNGTGSLEVDGEMPRLVRYRGLPPGGGWRGQSLFACCGLVRSLVRVLWLLLLLLLLLLLSSSSSSSSSSLVVVVLLVIAVLVY